MTCRWKARPLVEAQMNSPRPLTAIVVTITVLALAAQIAIPLARRDRRTAPATPHRPSAVAAQVSVPAPRSASRAHTPTAAAAVPGTPTAPAAPLDLPDTATENATVDRTEASAPASGAGGSGGGAPAAEDAAARRRSYAAAAGVALRARTLDPEPGDEGPVRIELRFENVGTSAVPLCDPEVDLPRRIEMLWRSGEFDRLATLAPEGAQGSRSLPGAPQRAPDPSHIVELRPGESVAAVIDARTLLEEAAGTGTGPLRFRMAYRGAPDALPPGTRAWNADPDRVVVSDELVFEARVPRWFEDLGGDAERLRSTVSRLRCWAPGSPDDAPLLSQLRADPGPAAATLALVATRAGSPGPDAAPCARKSLLLLRALGAEVLPTLRAAQAHPAISMAIAVIEDDERERTKAEALPASQPFRAIGGGRGSGTTFCASFLRPGDGVSVTYTLDATGAVYVARWTATGERTTTVPAATPERIVELKRAILRAKPWTWRAVRSSPRSGEPETSFSLSDGTGAALWLLSLRGDEALDGNPLTASVLAAFRAVDRDFGSGDDGAAGPAGSPALRTSPGGAR